MPVRWRVALAAVIAATIVGGFLPHGALSDAQSATREMVQAAEAPLMAPSTCVDATCGKGSPAASSPTPTVALVGVLCGLALAAIAAARLRRHRAHAEPLPAGRPGPAVPPAPVLLAPRRFPASRTRSRPAGRPTPVDQERGGRRQVPPRGASESGIRQARPIQENEKECPSQPIGVSSRRAGPHPPHPLLPPIRGRASRPEATAPAPLPRGLRQPG